MPVQGFTRARKHQFGRESVLGTDVAATRAYPFTGVPSVVLNWTDPDVDTGSIVKTVAPYRIHSDLTAALTDPAIAYDDIPLMMCALFGGQESPTGGGTAKTWTNKPSAVDPLDTPDTFTYEFGDDVLTDWFQLGGGILEGLTITGPEGLGPCTAALTWRFASAASTGSTDSPVTGTVPTPDLDVDTNPVLCLPQGHGHLHRRQRRGPRGRANPGRPPQLHPDDHPGRRPEAMGERVPELRYRRVRRHGL